MSEKRTMRTRRLQWRGLWSDVKAQTAAGGQRGGTARDPVRFDGRGVGIGGERGRQRERWKWAGDSKERDPMWLSLCSFLLP